MRLADVRSRASVYPAHERMDPYWGGMWNVGQTANWFTRRDYERLIEQGLMPPRKWLKWLDTPIADACENVAYGIDSKHMLSALAALGCWRTTSVEQLAAITGSPLIASPNSKVRTSLVATGLVAEGVVQVPGYTTIPALLRPISTAKTEPLFDILCWRDLVGLTHGQPWRSGAFHDRHNMLATELLLRLGEYADVALVVGEQLAQLGQLTGLKSNRAGDGMFVRSDGTMVVIEVTATVSSNFPAKVAKWATALEANRNLSVLFVDVTHPNSAEVGNYITKVIRKEVHKAMEMGQVMAGVPKRMMVAKWADWFPAAHEVDPSFFSLRAQRPTGRHGQEVWTDVEILDPFDFEAQGGGEALLNNSNLLYGVPHWQRTGTATLDTSRLTKQSPVPDDDDQW